LKDIDIVREHEQLHAKCSLKISNTSDKRFKFYLPQKFKNRVYKLSLKKKKKK